MHGLQGGSRSRQRSIQVIVLVGAKWIRQRMDTETDDPATGAVNQGKQVDANDSTYAVRLAA